MRMPDRCPACSGRLRVTGLACPHCGVRIEGAFDACPICSLEGENRSLLGLFLRARGNAKEIERMLGISYPTVRARLDRLWTQLDLAIPTSEPTSQSALKILAELREGKLSVDQAVTRLQHRAAPPAGSA